MIWTSFYRETQGSFIAVEDINSHSTILKSKYISSFPNVGCECIGLIQQKCCGLHVVPRKSYRFELNILLCYCVGQTC